MWRCETLYTVCGGSVPRRILPALSLGTPASRPEGPRKHVWQKVQDRKSLRHSQYGSQTRAV